MNQGISILQGPHHVAQKSRSTTFPLNDESFTSLLLRSLRVKFKLAGLAFAGHVPPAANAPSDDHGSAGSVSTASASAATVARAHRVLIINLRPSRHLRPRPPAPAGDGGGYCRPAWTNDARRSTSGFVCRATSTNVRLPTHQILASWPRTSTNCSVCAVSGSMKSDTGFPFCWYMMCAILPLP